jgi:predicted phage terminase large subunit-like protein
MANNRINPRTGKRFSWEEEERQKNAVELERKELEKSIQLLQRQQAILNARDGLMSFTKFTSPDPADPNDVSLSTYKNARHHDSIAMHLEEVENGDIGFLILTTAPRHGKSELVSRRLPAWYAGRHPDHDIVVATYNDDFAMDFGANVRAIINSPSYKQVFPDLRLRRGGNAKDRLETDKGGLITFVGRGGSLTGRGAHLLIIDDIIKDDKEANSKAIRDQAWNWFTKVALTRRRGKKLVVLTFTRWHTDDIIGRLTNSNTDENPYYSEALAKKIKIINLPAIAEDNDPMGREPGEALWPDGPDKFDLDYLEEQREFLGALAFESLYQGRPTLSDGSLFRRENMNFYDPQDLPSDLRVYAASDHAVSMEQRRDPSCFMKVGVDENDDIYVLDCICRQMPSDQQVEAMMAMSSGRRPIIWWAEKGHISKSIGPFLYKRMQETGNYINIVEVTPVKDKPTRAQSIIARHAMGKVKLPRNAPWVARAMDEMLAFPSGVHDDYVDTLGLIGLGLQSLFGTRKAAPLKKQSTHGTFNWLKDNDKWVEAKRRSASLGGF